MKVNELRIGNLVKELCLTDPYKDITGVDISRMWKNPNSELFNPIPLTEEWLIRFGFTKRKFKHQFIWTNKYREVTISQSFRYEESIFFIKCGYDIRYSPSLEHVHQLQNLFFALTNEELTL